MADLNDFNKPDASTGELDFIETTRAANARAASLDPGSAANRPIGVKRVGFGSSIFTLENWNGSVWVEWLRATPFGRALIGAADADAGQTALGASAVGKAVLTAVNADAGQTALGASAVGKAVLTAVNASAARSAIGAIDAAAIPFRRNDHIGFTLFKGFSGALQIQSGQVANAANTLLLSRSLNLNRAIGTSLYGTADGTITGGPNGTITLTGKLDTGAVVTGSWYFFYLISNAAGDVVDYIFSLSNTAAGVNTSLIAPAGLSVQRFIGAWRIVTGGGWDQTITQVDDDIYVPEAVVGKPANSTSGALYSPDATPPLICRATFLVGVENSSFPVFTVTSPFDANVVPSPGNCLLDIPFANSWRAFPHTVRINSSGQLRHRNTTGSGNTFFKLLSFNIAEAKGRNG